VAIPDSSMGVMACCFSVSRAAADSQNGWNKFGESLRKHLQVAGGLDGLTDGCDDLLPLLQPWQLLQVLCHRLACA